MGKYGKKAQAKVRKVIPTQDILEITGTFKPKVGKSVLRARQKLEQNYTG